MVGELLISSFRRVICIEKINNCPILYIHLFGNRQDSKKLWICFSCLCTGWEPHTSLPDLLHTTLTYQHKTYATAVKQTMSISLALH